MTHPGGQKKCKEFDRTKKTPCQSALGQAGINEAFVAKKLKEQLEAQRRRWNRKRKGYEQFPDNDAQLAALREAIKIFGGYPTENETNGGRSIWIIPLDPNAHVNTTGAPADSADATAEVTCASELRRVGVNEVYIAKKLNELSEAKEPRWNPKKRAFDLFPDRDARLAAIREIVKISGGYPAETEAPPRVIIDDLPCYNDSAADREAKLKLSLRNPSDGRERSER